MSSCDFLEFNDVLVVPSLKKKIILVSYIVELQCRVSFEGQHYTINDCSLSSPRTLA